MTTAYDFTFRTIDGEPLPLSKFKGKAVLVVNVASQCGLTPQYSGLEALWRAKRDKGLVVLGVPANDFGAPAPIGVPICQTPPSRFTLLLSENFLSSRIEIIVASLKVEPGSVGVIA